MKEKCKDGRMRAEKFEKCRYCGRRLHQTKFFNSEEECEEWLKQPSIHKICIEREKIWLYLESIGVSV